MAGRRADESAPSTPPPPISDELAAFTMTSTCDGRDVARSDDDPASEIRLAVHLKSTSRRIQRMAAAGRRTCAS
jgi:hypothetical protein